MTYLRNKRIIVFFAAVFLFLIFEGTISLNWAFSKIFYVFFKEREEINVALETNLLYKRIKDLELKLQEKESKDKTIPANVVFGGGYLFSDSIFLDKGSKDGVEKGDFVVYKSFAVLAEIDEVFSGYSRALPFSRFGEKTALRSGSTKNVLFEAEGSGGGKILAYLPQNSGVSAGDGVYLAKSSQFLVGLVETNEKKESRDFEEISIILPFSLRSVAEVDIVKNNVKTQ
ncbi:MAG: rod shape-determining protein MreC [Patescibacteria group bacterium]